MMKHPISRTLFNLVLGTSFCFSFAARAAYEMTPEEKIADEKSIARTKEVCKKLEAVPFASLKLIPKKAAKDDPYLVPEDPDLTVKKHILSKTDDLGKKCLLEGGTKPVRSLVLGKIQDRTYYYQDCGRKNTGGMGSVGGVFASASKKEIQHIFFLGASKSNDNFNQGEVQFLDPEFSIVQNVPFLKLWWVYSGTGAFHEAQYFYWDNRFWQRLDTSYWTKLIEQVMPAGSEMHYYSVVDLKTLTGTIRIKEKNSEEWRWAEHYEVLTVALAFKNGRLEPQRLGCKRGSKGEQ